MTYVEFFSRDAVKNVCACFLRRPQRVVLVGEREENLERLAARYNRIFEERGEPVEFVCQTVRKNDLDDVVRVLSEIVETYGEVVFNMEGSEDLCLVACGIVFERYGDRRIRMNSFNLRNNRIYSVDTRGQALFEAEAPDITVTENIRIYGGDVVFDDVRPGATHRYDDSPEFLSDVTEIWNVCRLNPKAWNRTFAEIRTAGGLTVTAPDVQIVRKLEEKGLISEKKPAGGNTVSFRCKNETVWKSLTKSGTVLELAVYAAARKVKDDRGRPFYHDVLTGVCIDWDGKTNGEGSSPDTENEIDVMMMHGAIPVFVSCKNGDLDVDELYKLSTVAGRFGGSEAVAMLFTTSFNWESNKGKYLEQRAKDMKIRIIKDAGSGIEL